MMLVVIIIIVIIVNINFSIANEERSFSEVHSVLLRV
jgi:hypothetical protein